MSREADGPDGSVADLSTTKAKRLAYNRRELLAVSGALLTALGLPASGLARASSPLGEAAFRDLSVALTGLRPNDPELSVAFRSAFSKELGALTKLFEIVRDSDPDDWTEAIAAADLADLADALVTAWYTGIVGQGDDQRVITYLDALVWHVIGYTKPPSACDTDFGAWARRPNGDF